VNIEEEIPCLVRTLHFEENPGDRFVSGIRFVKVNIGVLEM